MIRRRVGSSNARKTDCSCDVLIALAAGGHLTLECVFQIGQCPTPTHLIPLDVDFSYFSRKRGKA